MDEDHNCVWKEGRQCGVCVWVVLVYLVTEHIRQHGDNPQHSEGGQGLQVTGKGTMETMSYTVSQGSHPHKANTHTAHPLLTFVLRASNNRYTTRAAAFFSSGSA